MEQRSIGKQRAKVELRERGDNELPMIVGYGAIFYDGTADTQFELWSNTVERIMPGAFDRALREDDVRSAFNHDPALLLGRTAANTLRLSVDATGLRFEADPPDTQNAHDVVELLRRGDVDGASFAFDALGESWEKQDGIQVRVITDVRLWEVGPVTFPAYAATSSGLRRADAIQEAEAAFERWQEKEIWARERAKIMRAIRLAQLRSNSA